MTNPKVFIAGSRRLSRLSKEVKQRIERIIANRLTVVLGDANGMDKCVQRYLKEKAYENVIVFCMEGACRNNLGGWEVHRIAALDPDRRDFAFYSTKDKAMAAEADYGLMLWDGHSRGTLTNILELVRRGKPAVVYVAPAKRFHTVRGAENLAEILSYVTPDVLDSLDPELRIVGADQCAAHRDITMLF